MGAAEIIAAVAQLIATLGPIALQAEQAAAANDMATLKALEAQVVAASNALAPPGGIAPVAVD